MTATASSPRCRDEPVAPRGPDPVLAGDRAAERERGLVQLGARGVEADDRGIALVPVEDERRVEVAVARVPERPDADPVAHRDRLDRNEHLGDPAARHADVLHPRHALVLQRAERERRPCRSQSASCASCARITVVAPAASHTGTAASSSATAAAPGRSDSTSSIAAASRSRPEAVDVVDGADRELVHELERHRPQARPR